MAGEGIWEVIRQQVENVIASEPVMKSFFKKVVLDRQSLPDSVAYNLATKFGNEHIPHDEIHTICLLYTSPSPRDGLLSRMPSSA